MGTAAAGLWGWLWELAERVDSLSIEETKTGKMDLRVSWLYRGAKRRGNSADGEVAAGAAEQQRGD